MQESLFEIEYLSPVNPISTLSIPVKYNSDLRTQRPPIDPRAAGTVVLLYSPPTGYKTEY